MSLNGESQPLDRPHDNTNPTELDQSTNPNPLERFFNDLNDPSSQWHRLKLAEMAGSDYVFVPSNICKSLRSPSFLQQFLGTVKSLLGSRRNRNITLVTFFEADSGQTIFEQITIDWFDEHIIATDRKPIDTYPQCEFIHTLFRHSEPLVLKDQERGKQAKPRT